MCRAHPHLERAEGMLHRLTAPAHRLRVLIETPLHGFDHVLVFPSRNAPLRRLRTYAQHRTVIAASAVTRLVKGSAGDVVPVAG
jgi:hypothetical protein